MKKCYEEAEPVLKILRQIAGEKNKTVPPIAVHWVVMKRAISISGARLSKVARDNFGSMRCTLFPAVVDVLEVASSKAGEFGNGGFELV